MSSSRSSESEEIRVAHIMPWAGIGGVEIATLRLVDATRHQIHHVAFCMQNANVAPAFAERGIETVLYQQPVPSLRHFVRFYRQSKVLAARLREARADIVHFAEINGAITCGFAALLAGAKRVSHVRNVYPNRPLWKDWIILRTIQAFLFVSKQARDFSPIPGAKGKARVIYDAVTIPVSDPDPQSDADLRRELGIAPDAPVVGMVARVNPQKDYPTLARAASLVLQQRPDARFLIVGDKELVDVNRDHHAEIISLLQQLGIANSFVFAGHRADVNPLIRLMDFCVLSTHREGFPLSILETMAQRKPVIATEVGGIPEIIRPGENGYLVPHGDAEALAQRILSLLNDPELTQHMGQNAAALVQRDYSPSHFAQQIIAVYRSMVPSAKPTAA